MKRGGDWVEVRVRGAAATHNYHTTICSPGDINARNYPLETMNINVNIQPNFTVV